MTHFLSHYHQRPNVESTVMMVKSKFGDAVRTKTDVAAKNEVLCKLLCHNVCCLISAIYELGIEPVFAPRLGAQLEIAEGSDQMTSPQVIHESQHADRAIDHGGPIIAADEEIVEYDMDAFVRRESALWRALTESQKSEIVASFLAAIAQRPVCDPESAQAYRIETGEDRTDPSGW